MSTGTNSALTLTVISFFHDVTPYLRYGGNVLAVRVDQSKQKSSRWYSGSGIYRHVWLDVTGPLRISPWGVFVETPVAHYRNIRWEKP
ncbi:MAG TPA: hypothetical protein VGG72_13820 [Bryobacteraceae bacterium]|jgi:beta-galactosidase